ncbi:3'-5' exoribonuclease [Candidatus Pacearchaeota archaeon]|nr:3'-5' exoribonuclease [Candidatus Pacearchaeota archaeon]
MDGEFAKLKPDGIDLISIALIKPNGEELYLEIDYKGKIDEWVKENVVPKLNQKKVSRKEAVKLIKEFVGKEKPYVVAYVNQFDWMGICKLFSAKDVKGISEIPFRWVPIDFASILFSKGVNIGKMKMTDIARKYNIPTSKDEEHNALVDARILKKLYERIMG